MRAQLCRIEPEYPPSARCLVFGGLAVDISTDNEYHPDTFLNASRTFVTQGERKSRGDNVLLTRQTLAELEQSLNVLSFKLTELQKTLDDAGDRVKGEAGQIQARKVESSVAEAKRQVDAALEKCRLLKMGEVALTEESSDELMQILTQIDNLHIRQEVDKLTELTANATPAWKELDKGVAGSGISMSGLDTLSGIELEGLITRLLGRMGFRAEMTKASGDGGVDIVATLDQAVTGGRYLVQCKRYAEDSLVGAATVREFYGALTADRRAVKGILITTSGFTSQAQEFAAGLPIELIGRDQLQRLLEQHGLRTDALGPLPGSVVGAAAQPKDRAAELLELGFTMGEQNRYAEAVKLYRELTQLRPDDPNAWFLLGASYGFVGLHDEQIAALREAVRLKPDFRAAWHGLGKGLHAVGELDGAIHAFTQANAILSDDVSTWVELGRTYKDKGVKEGALLAYQKAVKIDPDCLFAWLDLGFLRWKQGETSEAISACRQVLRIDPNNAMGWNFLCILYREVGDRARLVQAVSRLEELDPKTGRDWRRSLG